MTSSIGGSSIVRSATGRSFSIRVVTFGASARETRSIVRPSSLLMISPYFERSAEPSRRVTPIVFVAEN